MSEKQEEMVTSTIEFGPSNDNKDLIEGRVNCIKKKLNENGNLRLIFLSDPLAYLTREGLLIEATEVKYEMKEGTFSDLVLAQSLIRGEKRGDLLQSGALCLQITVCFTIIIWGHAVTICVTEHV